MPHRQLAGRGQSLELEIGLAGRAAEPRAKRVQAYRPPDLRHRDLERPLAGGRVDVVVARLPAWRERDDRRPGWRAVTRDGGSPSAAPCPRRAHRPAPWAAVPPRAPRARGARAGGPRFRVQPVSSCWEVYYCET